MSRTEQAEKRLDLMANKGVVLVNDGADRWLCRESAYDACIAELEVLPAYETGDADEDIIAAYDDLCRGVAGPIASVIGSNRGEYEALVLDAVAAGLIDEEMAGRAYNVRIPYGQLAAR